MQTRRVLNEDEIASLASKQGFEIVRCEELSFETQVTLFSEASIVVGAHGAGLTNLVFAPRTAVVGKSDFGPLKFEHLPFENYIIESAEFSAAIHARNFGPELTLIS